MPYLDRPGARLFFDVTGDGPQTVLSIHGVAECGAYWGRTGVSQALADAGHRVVDLDMRGHGRSVPVGADPGYTVDRIADDLGAVASHVGAERFHLLTHATGGMAGLRFAMDHSDRLLSLVSTDTGSATMPSDELSHPDFGGPWPPPAPAPLERSFMAGMSAVGVHELMVQARAGDGRPFLTGFATNEDPDRCWRWVEDVLGSGNPSHVVEFGRWFYTDADPHIDGLRRIGCPNLVLVGELDEMFVVPSRLLAAHLPDCEHVVVPGRGHMLAIEDPEGTARAIAAFLARVPAG